MLLSTQTDAFHLTFGEAEAIRIYAKVGFDAFDLSLFRMLWDKDYALNGADWRAYAAELRAVAEQAGIVCNQAHAPFPSSCGEEEKDEATFQLIVRAMEAAAIVGAKIIVVHPKQHLTYADHAAELEEMNVAFYRRLIPYCERLGIQVAVENMWQYDDKQGRIVHSTCSSPEEFCRYLDRIDSPWIVGCLDIGHVPLVGGDLPGFIRALGRERLRALHVHDNSGVGDDHTLPYLGKIDFAAVAAALGEIGYTGDFTFEADHVYAKMPDAVKLAAAGLMHDTGRELMRQIEAAR